MLFRMESGEKYKSLITGFVFGEYLTEWIEKGCHTAGFF